MAWLTAIGVTLAVASPARAQETWLLDMELNAGLPVSNPQIDLFGPGGTASIGVLRTLAPWFSLGARLRTGLFLNGDKVQTPGVHDPGLGTLNMLEAALRFRLPDSSPRRATGGWIELNGGGGFTGHVLKPALGAGVGWNFAVGDRVALGPHARFLQIIETNGGLDSGDAQLVLVGLSLTALDNEPAPAPVPEPPPPDRDMDTIPDAVDACPDDPEDLDGFEDEDGCPDPDNDGDGILDVDDGCPNIAEDMDGFEDEDGCLDDDNDEDDILDAVDQCPNEPETLNGVDDEDGCPDKGLIEMREDRIVLEERVLFDTDRARVRSRGRPVLQAIVDLAAQHPEWTKVRIEGHADVRGNADFNQRLSERRAAAVRRALIHLGMNPDLLVAEGYGATRPLTEETTDEAHRKNRRVEFVVIAKHGQYEPGQEPVQETGAPALGEPAGSEKVAPDGAGQGEDAATDERGGGPADSESSGTQDSGPSDEAAEPEGGAEDEEVLP